jgi:hypothetical protein
MMMRQWRVSVPLLPLHDEIMKGFFLFFVLYEHGDIEGGGLVDTRGDIVIGSHTFGGL